MGGRIEMKKSLTKCKLNFKLINAFHIEMMVKHHFDEYENIHTHTHTHVNTNIIHEDCCLTAQTIEERRWKTSDMGDERIFYAWFIHHLG